MNSLVATLILIVLALAGARVSFSTDTVPPGPRLLFRTGAHFLFIGFALGPAGLGLLTTEATRGLFPFLALGLGWVGFHFGLQLDARALRLFPFRYVVLALGQSIVTFVLFAAVAYAVARRFGLQGDIVPLLVLGAASTAAVTTPAAIGMVSSTFQVQGKVRDLLFFVASLDALIGITALQVTYSLYRPARVLVGPTGGAAVWWVATAAGLGVVCGILFIWLARYRPTPEELTLYLLGISAFAAGAALQWGLSPLFVGVTMGAVVANFGRPRWRLLPFLQRWEQLVYVIFLLLAGALVRFPTWIIVPVALGYVVLRFGAKVASSALLVSVLRFEGDVPRRLGLGLIPQGGISIAMAVSGVLMYSDLQIGGVDAVAALFSVIVLGVVISELMGPFLTVSLLARVGEVSAAALAGEPEPEANVVATAGRDVGAPEG